MANYKNWPAQTCPSNQWAAIELNSAFDCAIDRDKEAQRVFTRDEMLSMIRKQCLEYAMPAGNA